MKKLTRKDKIKIGRQLTRVEYAQGAHTVHMDGGESAVIIVKGRTALLPAGRRLPVPEEWWV